MEKRFRTQLLERRLSIIIAVVHLFFVIKISLVDYLAGAPLMHLPVLFFVIVSNIILVFVIGEKLPVRLYLIGGRDELIEIFGVGHNIKH